MARKKTPPEYGDSPCLICQKLLLVTMRELRGSSPSAVKGLENDTANRCIMPSFPRRGSSICGSEVLTGPMIVACQWNCQRTVSYGLEKYRTGTLMAACRGRERQMILRRLKGHGEGGRGRGFRIPSLRQPGRQSKTTAGPCKATTSANSSLSTANTIPSQQRG